MERQVIRQPSGRGDCLQVPWPHRQRVASGGTRLQQRARKQGQADASLQRGCRPGARHLHRTRALGDIEVGLDWPPVAIGGSDLVGRQLAGGRANQQRTLVGRVIHTHDIKDRLWGIPEVQVFPASYSHLAFFNTDGYVFIRVSFWPLRPRMKYWPMQGRATTPAGVSWFGSASQRAVLTQATHQRLPLGRRPKLRDGGNPGIYTEQALLGALWQVGKDFGH